MPTSLSTKALGWTLRGARACCVAATLAASFAACGAEDGGEPEVRYMDVNQVQADLDSMDVDDDFELMNTKPFPSQVAKGRVINVWANGLARSVYKDVHVDGPATFGRLPAGAMIVREIFEADGTWVKDTVLVQQPEGFNPATQDMWFSETGPDGKLKADDLSAGCFTCHAGRQDHAFLFGVPLDYAR